MTFVAGQPLTSAQRRRAVLAVNIGNGLELYDFVTFAFFAIQIGHTFFPSSNGYVSLMASLATFGAGFVTRPLGAHILGGYADRAGRKPAMLTSMTMMGAGILLLALSPGYATIGIAAPLLALIARLLQGFALGGEIGSATAYMLESAGDDRRGFTASWQPASQAIAGALGSIVGLALSLVLTRLQLDQFGWRIALGLGASIVPFALLIRNGLPETHDVAAEPAPAVPFHRYCRVIGLGFGIVTAGTISTYIFHYMATYGQNSLHLKSSVAFAGQTANQVISIFGAMLGGWLSDRIGRRWVMIAPQCAFLVAITPCFVWLTTARTAAAFIGANVILSFTQVVSQGAIYAAITESLPRAVRARGFALVYSIPVAAFGGTTQLVVTWLLHVTGNPMSIGWYLTAVTAIGLMAMIAMQESAPVRLRRMAPAYS